MCKRKKDKRNKLMVHRKTMDSDTSMNQSAIAHIQHISDLVSVFKFAADKLVVIDFYAPWCGPCQRIAPILENWVDEYPDVLFVKVNVDKCDPELIEQYKVSSIPTFLFLKKAKVVQEFAGGRFPELKQIIESHRGIENFTPPSINGTLLKEPIIPEKLDRSRRDSYNRSKESTKLKKRDPK